MHRCSVLPLPFLLLGLAACQGAPGPRDEWIATIVASDPAFGGGWLTFRRLGLDTKWFAKGDAHARNRLVAEQIVACDRAAAELVARLAPEPDAAVAAFWRSDAGNALATGEVYALAGFPPLDGVLADFAERASDPSRVGETARSDVRAAIAAENVVSPSFAFAVGATHVRAEHAPAIASFYASAAGRRWLELRSRALAVSGPRYYAFAGALHDRGLLGSVYDGMDLLLPKAVFDE
jgi:hypothetical protein